MIESTLDLGSKKRNDYTKATNERSSKMQKRCNLTTDFTKPAISIQQFIDFEVTPSKEEYNRLKDLDHSQNVSKFSTNIGREFNSAAESLNRQLLTYINNILITLSLFWL